MVEALINVFGSVPSNSLVQLKGYSIETAALFPHFVSLLTPSVAVKLTSSLAKHLDEARLEDVLSVLFKTKLACADISSLRNLLLLHAKSPPLSAKSDTKSILYNICEVGIVYLLQNPQIASSFIINQSLSYCASKNLIDFFDRPNVRSLLQGNLGGFIGGGMCQVPTSLLMVKHRSVFAHLERSNDVTIAIIEYFLKENLNTKRRNEHVRIRRFQHNMNKLLAS